MKGRQNRIKIEFLGCRQYSSKDLLVAHMNTVEGSDRNNRRTVADGRVVIDTMYKADAQFRTLLYSKSSPSTRPN